MVSRISTTTVRTISSAAFPAASVTLYLTWYVAALVVSTLFVALIADVTSPPLVSMAVAPASTYVLLTATVTCAGILSVIVVVSGTFTTTVRTISSAAFPAASVTLYFTWYVSALVVSTEFVTMIDDVISPSLLSDAVAPSSTYEEFNTTVTCAAPFNAISGLVVSGTGITITVRIISSAAFPAASVTLYFTWYVSALVVSTVVVTLIDDVISPSLVSDAVAPSSTYEVFITTVTGRQCVAPFNVITGFVVSGNSTTTVRTTSVAAFPAASVTLYLTWYV